MKGGDRVRITVAPGASGHGFALGTRGVILDGTEYSLAGSVSWKKGDQGWQVLAMGETYKVRESEMEALEEWDFLKKETKRVIDVTRL